MRNGPLSVQLYTLRDSLEVDVVQTLKRVSDIGFQSVELYRIEKHQDAYRKALSQTGLSPLSAHASLIDGDAETALKIAADLGVATVIEPRIVASRWTNRADIESAAADLNSVAARARDFGLSVGYHNHHEEVCLDIGGTTGLEIFAERLDSDVVLEVDAFWAEVGGVSAPQLLQRLGERVAFLHVKDGEYTKDLLAQQALGSGQMPIREILAAAPQAARVIELDAYAGDVFTAVEESFAFLAEVDR